MKHFLTASLILALGLQIAIPQPSLQFKLEGLRNPVLTLDGSDDSNWVVLGASDFLQETGLLKIWFTPEDKPVQPLSMPTYRAVNSVRFLPNRAMFAYTGVDTPLTLMDYREVGGLWDWRVWATLGVSGAAMDLAPEFSAAAVAQMGRVVVLRGVLPYTLQPGQGFSVKVAFSPDGALLATGGAETFGGSVKFWRVDNLSLERVLPTAAAVESLAFSPNGALLATGDANGELRLWNLSNNAYLQVQAHTGAIRAVRFARGGAFLATGGDDGYVRFWSATDLSPLGAINTRVAPQWGAYNSGRVLSLFITPDGHYLYTGGDFGRFDRWRIGTLEHDKELTRRWSMAGFRTGTHELWVSEAEQTRVYNAQGALTGRTPLVGVFSPDKRWVIQGNRVVRVADGQPVLTSTSDLTGVFAPNSEYALIQEGDTLAAYRTDSWTRLWQPRGQYLYLPVQFSRDGRRFLMGSKLYDTETGAALGQYTGEPMALSQDGQFVAEYEMVAPRTAEVRLYEVGNPTPRLSLPVEVERTGDNTLELQFALGDQRLFLLKDDLLYAWDAATGALLWTIPVNAPATLAVAPNTRSLAIVERDAVRLFHAGTTYQPRVELLTGAQFGIRAVEFSSDGARVAVEIADSSVAVFTTPFVAGDVDGDGCVDDRDLLSVLFAFGSQGGAADVNNDGIVDDADLLSVLFAFGGGC
ncbi:MAG: WD40 repeat domain-containing protein [bacterium]|nr:WD40 repeat domain-containing protein [bacterium]